jgi:hypothetical protein
MCEHWCINRSIRRATMRKVMFSIAAAAATLAIAAPASAQVYGNAGVGIGVGAPGYGNLTPYNPAYNYQPYNYGYGYNGYAFVQQMQQRVLRIRADIRNMERRRMLSVREARSLDREANAIQRQIYRAPRGGIRPQEARRIENRIRNLEVRVQREAWDWNRRPGHYRR